jgi:hypothetical protein
MEARSVPATDSQCPLHCLVHSSAHTESPIISFKPDEAKKNAAFWLADVPSCSQLSQHPQAPVTLAIESSRGEFVLGGFQLQSNSKLIKVYVKSSADGEREYLTTCRGVGDPCKAICAIPGGPRLVFGLYLEFQELKPKEETIVRIVSLKVTARIPQDSDAHAQVVNTSSSQKAPISSPSALGMTNLLELQQQQTQQSDTSSSLSDDQIASAMAAVSMMMRATESRIIDSITTAKDQQLEQTDQLTRMVLDQKICIEKQSMVLVMQSNMLSDQAQQIEELRKGQEQIIYSINSQQLAKAHTVDFGSQVSENTAVEIPEAVDEPSDQES